MEDDIIYDPDWIVMFVIFFCILLLIIGILAAAYFFVRKSWVVP